ncbi:MAG: hypothetical protein N3D16_04030 [Anaerolineales bacterium]|nr:hypothetical protein [Anaerolineales bacterium]
MRIDKQILNRYLSLILIFFCLSCTQASDEPSPLKGTYSLHSNFRTFYDRLGGVSRLGPAISPLIEKGDKQYQYTTAVLMEYDRTSGQVQLSPLGYEFGFRSVTVGAGDASRPKIYPLFEKIYTEMGGEEIIGPPLADVRYNEQLGRYEQYFERAGFYILEGDVSQTVYLLSYGAWKCRQSCTYPVPENSRIDLPTIKAEPMIAFVYRYGVEFSGFALSEPYLAEDGLVEQIYENVVLAFNPEHPEQVNLRPLPQILQIPTDPFELRQSVPGYEWVSVEQDQGFLVPERFWEYLQAHGGLELSGPPQTKAHNLSEGLQRQCFVKFCIEDQIDLYGNRVVRLSKLGEEYRRQKMQTVENFGQSFELNQITLRPYESRPMVSPDHKQEIGVRVYSANQPLEGISPELILTYPDGREEKLTMPPTDAEGKTQLELPPVQAENGTLIPYRVCVQDRRKQRFCVQDSFLIWKTEELQRQNVQYLPAIFNWLEKAYQIFLPLITR